MRLVAQPVINTAPIEACTASLRGWLTRLLEWFCAVFALLPPAARPALGAAHAWAKAKVAADLRFSVRALRLMLVGAAFARLTIPAARARDKRHPGSERAGVRRARRKSRFLRRVTAGALAGVHAGALHQRARRLRVLLDNLEALTLRVLKRMQAMFARDIGAGLVLVAAFEACESLASAPPTRADTS